MKIECNGQPFNEGRDQAGGKTVIAPYKIQVVAIAPERPKDARALLIAERAHVDLVVYPGENLHVFRCPEGTTETQRRMIVDLLDAGFDGPFVVLAPGFTFEVYHMGPV